MFPDPTGGTYDQSVLLRLAGTDGWMNNSALQPPGFKVSCSPPCRSIRFMFDACIWQHIRYWLGCLQDLIWQQLVCTGLQTQWCVTRKLAYVSWHHSVRCNTIMCLLNVCEFCMQRQRVLCSSSALAELLL